MRAIAKKLQKRLRSGTRASSALQATVVVGALALGVWLGHSWEDSKDKSPGLEDLSTRGPSVEKRTPQPSLPTVALYGDWADSVEVPDFVTDIDATPGATQAYQPIGSAPSSAPLPPPAPALNPADVRMVPVVRTSSDALIAFDIGAGNSKASPIDYAQWSLLMDCSVDLRITGPWPSARGKIQSRVSDWLFGLAVPIETCQAFLGQGAPRQGATPELRRALAFAAQSNSSVRGLGAPAFREADLRDIVVSGRTAWGVFRKPVATTQIYPPPPLPQLAFVARSSDGEQWVIEWVRYSPDSGEMLGLAGVYDLDGDGRSQALFGVRSAGGATKLLVVGEGGEGWALERQIPLGDVIR